LIRTGPAEKLTPLSTLSRLWRWRDFVWTLTARELKSRYVGSIGGFAWNVIQPLVLIAVFTLIFSALLRVAPFAGGQGYIIFLVSGLLPWNAFQDAIQRSSTVFLEYSTLVQKLPFPLEGMVAQTVASAGVNLVISLALLVALLPVLGVPYSARLAFLPVGVLLQVLLTAGPGLMVASLAPFWRDVPPITGMVLFIGFWVTPIVYMPHILPDKIAAWFQLNPVYQVIRVYRYAFTGSGLPSGAELGGTVAFCLALTALGWWIFSRVHRKIPEAL